MAFVHGHTGSHFLDSLSLENFDLINRSPVDVVLTRDDALCVPGDDLDCVWLPTTAILSVVTILADGQDVEACTSGHESAFGLLNALGSGVAIDRVIAQVPGRAIRLAASRLREAAALSISITV
jgi:hypothetical protein